MSSIQHFVSHLSKLIHLDEISQKQSFGGVCLRDISKWDAISVITCFICTLDVISGIIVICDKTIQTCAVLNNLAVLIETWCGVWVCATLFWSALYRSDQFGKFMSCTEVDDTSGTLYMFASGLKYISYVPWSMRSFDYCNLFWVTLVLAGFIYLILVEGFLPSLQNKVWMINQIEPLTYTYQHCKIYSYVKNLVSNAHDFLIDSHVINGIYATRGPFNIVYINFHFGKHII